MLRAAIVEKAKERRAYIRAALMGTNLDIQVQEFTNEYDYLENLNEDGSSFDLLILNTTICQEGDGVRLAARLRERNRRVMICFVTDSSEYYAEAFGVLATGYFLYPFDVRGLHNCITFFWQKPEVERRASLMLKEAGGSYRRVFCRNILYIESSGRKAILHLEDGALMESYAKLDELEQLLSRKLFFRCHQSYIISMYFVEKMESGRFWIQNQDIPISRKYQKDAKETYYEYMFEKM